MKLYQYPVSTACRPVRLFLADHHMPMELIDIDILAGEQRSDAFLAINPNGCVPVLVDGDWSLTEASAILKHLADTVGSPTYPADRKARSTVNAAMDWFNTGFYHALGHQLVYPQVLPEHALADRGAQAALLAHGEAGVRRWLDILDGHMLANRDYVAGTQPTIADYLGVAYVTLGDWVGFNLAPWPRVAGWVARMRARPASRDEWARHDALVAYFASLEPAPPTAAATD